MNMEQPCKFRIKLAHPPAWGGIRSVTIGRFENVEEATERARQLSAEFQDVDAYVCDFKALSDGSGFWREIAKFTYGKEAKL